ncbi:nuclear export factor GLE1 [Mycobacterium colombiense]|uniref:Nuclear export factor GLE1 n=1 Tax=Mycobacterium colombiense TaxID=339268 RepID=A0A1A2SAZ9_9MYCO|nr:YcnI family protein [Mycobacterium colombiense]OBH60922.1 nuclear export factor GLE1 [Mycobacterium colombiense]
MAIPSRWISRTLIALAAVVALYLGSAAQPPAAWAHVHASSDNAVRGAMAIVTFQVPNESNTGALTTALTVTLPNVASARTESQPGWTAKLDRDAASGTVRSVTWTANLTGGIGPDQFGLFRLSVKLPDTDTVSFPATQTYADGTVVKWDQPPLPDGGEPEHPVPMLNLAAGPSGPHPHHGSPGSPPAAARSNAADNAARLLGGAALVVAAAGVAIALIRRRT